MKKLSVEEELAIIDWDDAKQRAVDGKTILIQRTPKPTDTPELNKAIRDKLNKVLSKEMSK